MAKKPTKRQRIDEKIAAGMDHIEAQKAVIQEDAEEQIRKLDAQVAKERAKVETEAVSIIREQYPAQWEEAMDIARDRIDERRYKRAAAASKPRGDAHAAETDAPSTSDVPVDVAGESEQAYSY